MMKIPSVLYKINRCNINITTPFNSPLKNFKDTVIDLAGISHDTNIKSLKNVLQLSKQRLSYTSSCAYMLLKNIKFWKINNNSKIMQDEQFSPDLFESPELLSDSLTKRDHVVLDIEDEMFQDVNWRGTNMYDVLRDGNPWNHYTPPLSPSRNHTVLFQLPVTLNKPPKPHYSTKGCQWDTDYVRMPFSPMNLFPVQEGDEKVIKPRWEIIQCSLLKPIVNSQELEQAILSYNKRSTKLKNLHIFFEQILMEEETKQFFQTELAKIIQLALQLPELIGCSVPILKTGKPHSLSISQLQIASILANAFLCTFPWKENMRYCPGINFFSLFDCNSNENYMYEKLKCLLHYFRRVCNKAPVGVITFERKYLSESRLPRWDKLDKSIATTKLYISSSGTIEDDGLGCLQVDFANCMIGGGALGQGSVQEEIRFMICPELIASMLFTERLAPTEALVITGAETYSRYKGYASKFEWAGNCHDETPFDLNGRRRTSIVAIDATFYTNRTSQFRPARMIRELHKAYVGFYEDPSISRTCLAPIATGNWGCGAFRGNVHLKALLQIMACTAVERDIVYFTFGNAILRDEIYNIHQFLVSQNVEIKQLWHYLCLFNISQIPTKKLFPFIQQAHFNKNKKQNFFTLANKKNDAEGSSYFNQKSSLNANTIGSSSHEIKNDQQRAKSPQEELSSSQDIEASHSPIEKKEISQKKSKLSHEDIVSFLHSDEESEEEPKKSLSLLQELDNICPEEKMEISEIDSVKILDDNKTEVVKNEDKMKNKSRPRKISDYFQKL